MPKILIDTSYGLAEFEFSAGQPAATLDLIKAQDAYRGIYAKHAESNDPNLIFEAWADWLQAHGFPPLGYAAAFKVVDAINDALAELKKKDHPPASSDSPGSPASTASPPSA